MRRPFLVKAVKIIGKILLTLLVTAVIFLIACTAGIFLLEKGPSETARREFVIAVNETSFLGFTSGLFLSDEEIEGILDYEETTGYDTSSVDSVDY